MDECYGETLPLRARPRYLRVKYNPTKVNVAARIPNINCSASLLETRNGSTALETLSKSDF